MEWENKVSSGEHPIRRKLFWQFIFNRRATKTMFGLLIPEAILKGLLASYSLIFAKNSHTGLKMLG